MTEKKSAAAARPAIRRRKKDRYRHYDPETGAILNGGPGKPRPSRQLPEEKRKDYQFGGRVPNEIGEQLEGIMGETGENKTELFRRILADFLKRQQKVS
jgi:hypothetical protein